MKIFGIEFGSSNGGIAQKNEKVVILMKMPDHRVTLGKSSNKRQLVEVVRPGDFVEKGQAPDYSDLISRV